MGFCFEEEREGLLQLAIEAGRRAADLIARYDGRKVARMYKEGGESLASQVVTEVDSLAQREILDTLAESCERFGLAVLSEELADDGGRFEADAFWCIDPIDGTLPFVKGEAGYSVSIALVSQEGESLLGVICDPRTRTVYAAAKGLGVFRNGAVWYVERKAVGDRRLLLVNDASFSRADRYSEILTELEREAVMIGFSGIELRLGGGAAMNAVAVLESGAACYFKFPKAKAGGGSVWDFAASSCLFQERGAVAETMGGEALALNPRGSCFMNERGVLFASDERIARAVRAVHGRIEGV